MENFHIFTSPHCRQFKLTAILAAPYRRTAVRLVRAGLKPAPYCLVRAGFKPAPYCLVRAGFKPAPYCLLLLLLLLLLATAPAFAQTPNLEVCAGDGFMITSKADAQSISGGVTYTWQVSVNNGSYTVVPDQTAASLPVPLGKSAGTYAYVRYAAGDACPNGVSTTPYTVLVKPVPTITIATAPATANQTVTGGTTITPVQFQVVDASGVILAGSLPAGVSGAWGSGTYTISGTPTVAGTYTYTVTATATNGCPDASASGTITVKCPYTGDDLYMADTYACQQRTTGAENWEAWIQDTRDDKIYRIVLMPNNEWWFADYLDYEPSDITTKVLFDLRYYTAWPDCPAAWTVWDVAKAKSLIKTYGDTNLSKVKSTTTWNATYAGNDYYGLNLKPTCVYKDGLSDYQCSNNDFSLISGLNTDYKNGIYRNAWSDSFDPWGNTLKCKSYPCAPVRCYRN